MDTNTLFSTAAQTITITDTTKPDITAPENITKEATGPTTPVTVGLATATDLVTDPVIITRSPTADAFAVGTHTITWKADDGNGNIITAEQTITITDTTKPVITLTNDNADSNTVELGSAYTEHGATATDAVDDNTELTRKIAINAGAVDVNRLGTYPVTYDVSDTEGNPAERVTRMVMVTDTTEPDITAPANMTFEATDTLTPLGRTHYGTATSTDREAMITDDAPDAFPLGDTTITWTATDPATNEMIATQVVTVVDTTKPVIALNGLPEVRVEFGGSYTELQATATDAVDDDIQLTDKIVIAGTVDTNLAGIYHITYDVTDAAGNDAITVTRTVTLGAAQIVIDKVPPTIIAPSDVVVEATSPRTTVRVGQATATDNMDPMPAITRTPTGNEFVVGKHTITWTATDASDNSNSAEQTITITDTTKPVIVLLGDNPQTVEFGSVYNDPGATATDAVDDNDELTTQIAAASTVDTGTVGDYTITYTVSDTATNAATPVLRTVTVNPAPASTDANLSSLTLSAGTLSPTFAAGTISYAVNVVVNDVASTTVTPTTADAGATVTVAGETVTSGEASAAIDLTVGENAIAIVVTAEDGTAMKTYTVSVTRADNTAPSIQGRAAVNYAENEPITTIVTTYTATDAESNAITWSLGGTDADQLSIGATSGVLTFNAPPNFEDAQDTDTNNKYQVTVTATDNGEPNMSSTLNVTVTVTNVDEPGAIGTITGSAQVGQELTAGIVTDPDGVVADSITWQWQSADDDSDIDSATESTYILAVADFGKPIQVVATYNDGHGDDKQVTSAPTDTVVAADAPDAPSIALAVDTGVDPSDGITSNGQVNVTGVVTDATWKYTIKGTVTEVADSSVTFFTLDEGEYAATEVQVVQTLLGTDSAAANLGAVTVDRTPPVISLNGAATITLIVGDTTYTEQASVSDNLDASITLDISGETVDTQAAGTYTLTYDATDAAGNEAMQVERTVTVNPVPNTAPSIQGRAAVNYAENEPITTIVATYTATDAEGNTIIWEIAGTDADQLSIDPNGALTFRSAPDYETKSTYLVSVHVTETDGVPSNLTDELAVTVTVTNVDEPGAIGAITGTAQVGQTLTAGTVTDPDGGVIGTTYKWQSADDDSDIGGATESTYILAVADFGKPIQVIATYTDAFDDNEKSITSAPTDTVVAADAPDAPSIALAVDTGVDPSDGITSNGQVNVTGVVTDATWKYTINGGSTFTPAIGSSFTLTQGEYAATEVQVVQTLLGTDSAAANLGAVTVDRTPPVIDLNGAATITLTVGQNETNPPSATDNVDDNVTVTADIDIATVAAGTYTLTYTAMDAAGNAADRVTRTVIVQPILAISAGPELTSSNAGNYAKHGDTLTLTFTVNLPLTSAPTVSIAGQSITATKGTGNSYTATYTVVAAQVAGSDGMVASYDIGAMTAAGNPANALDPDAADSTIRIDVTAPVIDLNGGDVTLTVGDAYNEQGATATDAVDGSVNVVIDGATVDINTADTYIITYTATDTAGNIADQMTRTVTVAPVPLSANADLSSLTISVGTLPTFAAATTSYAVNVDNDVTSVTLMPSTADAAASVTVAGTAVTSGATSGAITLTVGANPIAIVVTAEDGTTMKTYTVTVTRADNTAPSIQGRAAVDYAENGAGSVATYTATDVESNAIAWTLTGTDARLLSIDANGVLTFRSAPDYETKSTYLVSVHVTETDGDPNNLASELPVTVTVTNVDEPGAIGAITGSAQVGQELTAGIVTDPDGVVADSITWQWQSADDDSDIDSATESTYILAVADFGKPIQVVATYNDGHGDDKQVTSAPTDTVVAADAPDAPSIALAVDTGVDPSDGITSNGQVNVTGVVTDATWKYTIKGTVTEVADSSVTFFTLDEGEYAATEVQVVQTLLGTDSAAANLGAVTVDRTAPVIDLNIDGSDVTLTVGDTYTEQASVSDNLDASITLDISGETVDTQAAGTYTLTYDATDAAGNEAMQVTRMVMVTDTTKPDITAPADMTFEARSVLTPLSRSHYGIATSTDDTADITDDAPPVFPLGDTTITWTATDESNNEMMDTQVVTVVDTTKPSIAAPGNIIKEATGYTTLVTPGQATATDFVADMVAITRDLVGDEADLVVGSASVGDIQMGNEFAVGTHKIIWTADDGNGNISTAAQTITITDTTKPVIVLLGDNPQTVEFGSIYNDPGATATDLVDADNVLTTRITAISTVNTARLGTYPVTYDVSDTARNPAARVTRTVMVTDTAAPGITAPIAYTTEATATRTPLSRSNYGTATSSDGNAMITDNAPAAFPLGDTTITWRATDESNNEMIATQVVTVQDTTKPVITLLDDNAVSNTVEFGSIYNDPGATATDAVDDNDELTTQIAAASTVDTDTVGDYTVTYTVSDTATNAATPVLRMVTVTDTVIPDITAPADMTFEARSVLTPLSRSHYGTATSTDGTADITDDAPDVFPLGPTTITWTATDNSNNEMLATQVITVQDTTKPRIALLGANPQIIGFGNAYIDPGATATDAVDDNDVLTTQIAAVSTVDTGTVGDYTITYDVTDAAGNAAITVTRTVTVTDIATPGITAPDAMTFEARAGMTPLDRADYGTATSTDPNADITDDAPDTFPMGDTMITWTATGINGLSSADQQMITVEDTTPPTITLLGDNPLTLEVGRHYIEPGATAVDSMAGELTGRIGIDATDLDTNRVGTYTVTYTVADTTGNEAQASRSIQVLAAPDFADLNRIILSEVARSMADQNVHAVARRLEQVGGKAARSASLGGQSSLAGIITAQGRALADDQFNIKRLLADTDFVLPLGTAEGASEGAEATAEATSRLTFWGAGDYRNISDSDQLTWDGDLFSLHLGLDTQLNASLVAGVALSWNQVALDYSNYTSTPSPDRAGRIASSGDYALEMTSIHPYVGWNLGQVDFWATLGYGEGELESTDEAAPLVRNLSSELNLQTLALGASGPLLAAGTNNLRMKVEALRTELEVAGNEQLAALSLDVSRLRMTLEATGTWSLDSGAQLGLLMEGGLRYDGGAGKTGSGTEIGSGLRYVSAANRLTLEAKARGVAHYKGGIEEWGLSGLIKYQGAADGRGLSFSLMPAYGETTSSNLQQLWQPGLGGPEYGDPGRSDYAPRIDLRLDYGMLAPGARVHLTPYGEMTWGDGSDTYRLGLRWQVDSLFDVKLVAERRERLGATEHSILLEGSIAY